MLGDFLDKAFALGGDYLNHRQEIEIIEAKATAQQRETVEVPQQPNAYPVTSPVTSNPRQAVMPFDPTWQGLRGYVDGMPTGVKIGIGVAALAGLVFVGKKAFS